MHLRLLAAVLVLAPAAAPAVQAQTVTQKKPVKSADDLPRYSYAVQGSAAALLANDAALAAFAARVRADTETTLATYDITDRATLRRLHGVLRDVAMLGGDTATIRRETAILIDLQDKEADRLQAGLFALAYLDALDAGPTGSPAFRARFRERYAAALAPLPWGVIGADFKESAGTLEAVTPALLAGIADQNFGTMIEKSGAIGSDAAPGLLALAVSVRLLLPLKDEVLAVETAYIAANDKPKADIWAARAAVFPAGAKLTPVVVGIWDSGVDMSLFPNQVWTNPGEKPNGIDDDHNGYVDDIHGIAFDEWGRRTPDLLAHAAEKELGDRLAPTRDYMQGLNDQQTGTRSEAAKALIAHTSAATPAEMKQMIADFGIYSNYAHGTHVAGIVAQGDPAVRLIGSRLTFDVHALPRRPTVETATAWAKMHQDTVDYFKKAGVRVVNMSWTVDLKTEYEDQLEANGVPLPERAEEARRLFAIDSKGLRDAIASAPEILFVVAAGNNNDSAAFSASVPAAIDAPNVLTVAAVDQAGDATSFTSAGPTVDIAADGFHVESYLPGGSRQSWSGTSMASPGVVNAAAKLFALDPGLTVAQVRAILLETATPSGDFRLLNPKAAMERVIAMRSGH